MKKLALVAVGLVVFVTAGFAVAKGMDNKTATAVSGTFAATTLGKTDSRTCTTTDGKSITTTHAIFTGTAVSGTADLNGPVTVDTHSVINTTDSIGVVNGHLKIGTGGPPNKKTDLHFTGVYDHGTVVGLATGHAMTHGVQVVGNLSGAFSTSTGFAEGSKIGGGTSGGSAVELGPGRCAPVKPDNPIKPTKPAKPGPDNKKAEGTVTFSPSVTPTSITVNGLTCAVPSNLAATVASFGPTDKAHIRCALVGGVTTLVKIDKDKH